jgi:hypothetical protein
VISPKAAEVASPCTLRSDGTTATRAGDFKELVRRAGGAEKGGSGLKTRAFADSGGSRALNEVSARRVSARNRIVGRARSDRGALHAPLSHGRAGLQRSGEVRFPA